METIGWLWLLLAVLNALWARGMNRSGMNWFVISLFVGPLATILIRVWPRLPESGQPSWTSAQLVSGGVVALTGASVCAWVALELSGGILLWTSCALYLVGAAVFGWLFVRERAERFSNGTASSPSSQTGAP